MGRPSKLPWDVFLSGEEIITDPKDDFDYSIEGFKDALKARAKELGVTVEAKLVGADLLAFRFSERVD